MNLDADSAGLLWFWLGTAFLWTSGWLPDMKKISRLGPSPFKPGYGAMAPVLAGRDCERARLGDFVDCLVRKEAPASAAAIWGQEAMAKPCCSRTFGGKRSPRIWMSWTSSRISILNLIV